MTIWYSKDVSGLLMAWLRKPSKWGGMWVGCGGAIITSEELPEGVRPEWTDEEPVAVEYVREIDVLRALGVIKEI